MTLQVRKEWRALRSSWLTALALALVPLLPLPRGFNSLIGGVEIWMFVFFVGCLLMGMESLGHEFNYRTFGLSLVHPVSRRGLWEGKMRALALGLGTTMLLFLICSLYSPYLAWWFFEARLPVFRWILTAFAVALAGVGLSLYLTLLVRQQAAVFWLSLLLPLALFGFGGMIFEKLGFGSQSMATALAVVGSVGAGAWWMAYRRFVRAEDSETWGQELHLPWLRRGSSGRPGTPGSSLWWKELRLHQLPVVIALMMIGLLVMLILIRPFTSSDLMSLMLAVWSVGWVLVPLLIGAGAVAEERRWGTLAGQRVLAVSWNRQWWIKVAGAHTASFVLGAVLPALLTWLAWLAFRSEIKENFLPPWWFWTMPWILVTTLGLYGSSLSRNLMQALWATTLVTGATCFLFSVMVIVQLGNTQVLKLGLTITAVLGLPSLLCLARSNSKAITVNPGLVRRNVAWVSGLLLGCGVLVTGIYSRVWEYVTPWPDGGAPLAPVAGVEPGIYSDGSGRILALTTDGRLWLVYPEVLDDGQARWGTLLLGEGRVWTQAGMGRAHAYGLTTDGSLYEWDLTQWQSSSPAKPPRRLGAEGEWKSISVRYRHATALKQDGTLWGWRWNTRLRFRPGNAIALSPDDAQSEPIQLSPRTDWKLATSINSGTLAADGEGAIWRWSYSSRGDDAREGPMEPLRIAQGTNWIRLSGTLWSGLGQQADGSTWLFGVRFDDTGSPQAQPATRIKYPIRALGNRHHRTDQLHALNSKGQLCAYPRDMLDLAAFAVFAPKPLGPRTDWVGLADNGMALTADGVVWVWHEPPSESWLGPSRRPKPLLTLGR